MLGLTRTGWVGLRRKRTFRLRSPQSFRALFLFFLGFALDALRGDRPHHEPLFRDGPSTVFARAIRSVVNPIQRLFDLGNQISFAIFDPQKKVPIRFEGSSVGGVREVSIAFVNHSVHCFFSFLN